MQLSNDLKVIIGLLIAELFLLPLQVLVIKDLFKGRKNESKKRIC